MKREVKLKTTQLAGWRAFLAVGVLAIALTACGSSGASSSGTTTTTTPKPSTAAFTACLKSHGVTLPSFGGGTGGGFGGGTGGGGFGGGAGGGGFGGGTGGGGFASNPKFSAAFKACASLRPKGGFGGNGADSVAFKAYTNCLKIYGVTLPSGRFRAPGSTSTSTSTTTPASAAKLKNAEAKCVALLPKGFGRGGVPGSSTTTTT
jgi:hypothetical protein